MDRKYLVIIEKADDGSYSAYVPDLPGCASCAETADAVRQSIREAIEMYLEDMLADGQSPPEPTTQCEFIDAPAA